MNSNIKPQRFNTLPTSVPYTTKQKLNLLKTGKISTKRGQENSKTTDKMGEEGVPDENIRVVYKRIRYIFWDRLQVFGMISLI